MGLQVIRFGTNLQFRSQWLFLQQETSPWAKTAFRKQQSFVEKNDSVSLAALLPAGLRLVAQLRAVLLRTLVL